MFKNVATKIALFAFDTATGAPKTGDAANLTAYVSKDYGTVTVLADTSATEMDATNARGWYLFDVAQGETNADALLFSGKSSTSGVSVVGQYLFTTPNRFSSLVIDAAGLADANAVKVGPSGAGTAQTAGDIIGDTNDIQTRLPAALVSGRIDASVGAMAADSLTATALAASAVAEIQSGLSTLDAAGVRASVGLASANLDAQLSAIDDLVDTEVGAIKVVTDRLATTLESASGSPGEFRFTADALVNAPTAGGGSAPTAAEIADAVWDEALVDHLGAGSTGAALNAAGAAGDPWITALPGAYSPGTAGYIIGTNLDAEVGSIKAVADALATTLEPAGGSPGEYRFTADALDQAPTGGGSGGPTAAEIADAVWDEPLAAHAGAGTAGKIVDDALDAAISTRASQASLDTVDATVDEILTDTGTTLPATLSTLAGYIDTEVAAIKAKTDNLPAAPAAVSDIPTALQNADALLNRDMSAVGDTNARSPLNALRFLRNKWAIAGTTLSVKKEDDSTEAWNAAVSTTPGADPVTGNDPA